MLCAPAPYAFVWSLYKHDVLKRKLVLSFTFDSVEFVVPEVQWGGSMKGYLQCYSCTRISDFPTLTHKVSSTVARVLPMLLSVVCRYISSRIARA